MYVISHCGGFVSLSGMATAGLLVHSPLETFSLGGSLHRRALLITAQLKDCEWLWWWGGMR